MKRIFSLFLALLLLLFAGCEGPVKIASDYTRQGSAALAAAKTVRHGETPFSQMELAYPDPDSLLLELDALKGAIGAGADKNTCISRFETLASDYSALASAESLAYVLRCRDVTNEESAQTYQRLSNGLSEAQYRLVDAELLLMDTYGYEKELGEAYRQYLEEQDKQNSPEIQSLKSREEALCSRYDALSATFTVSYADEEWTYQELMGDDSLSLNDFFAAVDLYFSQYNRAAGEIYLELVSIRKEIARSLGYDSYPEYRYAGYGRDYTPQEALSLAQSVKESIVPLYCSIRKTYDNDISYLYGTEFAEGETLPKLKAAITAVAPQAAEAWDYMQTYGLFDSAVSEKKMKGSFTTYFASYECPYLFTQWEGNAATVQTVVHEFGHFLNYYCNPEAAYYASNSLDLAEVDSQALELLVMAEYGGIFGRYANAARISMLSDALFAVLSGFMEDEFQQKVYSMENPTIERINALYLQLAEEYGLRKLFGYTGTEWVNIEHTFSFPFYYVSYGVSMLGAFSLWEEKDGNSVYQRVLLREPYSALRATLKKAGAEDPLSPEAPKKAAEAVRSYLAALAEE